MNIPMIPRQLTVTRTQNYGFTYRRISRVYRYDDSMMAVFPFFVSVPEAVARYLTDALGKGYTHEGHGPFYPSFSSMNGGEGQTKVVWFSQAGLECLQKNLVGEFIFTVEPVSDKLIKARENLY